MSELNLNQMKQVTGGVWRMVNTGVSGLNAALRNGPGKNNKQIATLPNGTQVNTVTDQIVYDSISGRNFVEVDVNGMRGWVAASIVGLPR